MAADSELLVQAELGEAGARVYSWDGPWVSLGRSQTPGRALRQPALVPFVSRPTGGKAVLHGHDMTVALALPLQYLGLDSSSSKSVVAVYRSVVAHLIDALRLSGVDARLGEDTNFVGHAGHTSDCFAHVARNDIVDPQSGQKVCGCALRLTSLAVLVQASVPIAPPIVDPSTVFDRAAAVTWVKLDPSVFARHLEALLDRTASCEHGVT